MAIRIGSNISSLQVQRSLSRTSKSLSSVFERLGGGLRINRASDDAAGLSIASSLGVNKRVFNQGVRNLSDGLSLLNVAEGAVGQLSNIVIRQRELAEQAANGTISETQRNSLNQEAQALFAEYERILNTTEFNGQNLLNGNFGTLTLQGGFGENGELGATIREGSIQQTTQESGLGTYTANHIGFGGSTSIVFGPEFLVNDFNNDGIDDIIAIKARDTAPGNLRVEIGFFLGDEDGNFSLDDAFGSNIGYSGTLLGVNIQANAFDAGGDGDRDLRLSIGTIGSLGLGLLEGYIKNETVDNGSFGFASVITTNPFSGPNRLLSTATGDFNNDGVQDEVTVSGSIVGGMNIRIQNTETLIIDESFVGETLEQTAFSLESQGYALQALDSLESDLDRLNRIISRIGASQSRIATASSVLQVSAEDTAAAQSRILDVDVASEAAKLTRLSLLQQASASILSQANQQPAIALSLLSNI